MTKTEKIDKELALKNMSKFLLQGAEMLRQSCPNCEVPLLKNKNDDSIFCGGCGNEVMLNNQVPHNSIKLKSKTFQSMEFDGISKSIEVILYGKLENIANTIAGKDPVDIGHDLELMKNILEIIGKIRSLN